MVMHARGSWSRRQRRGDLVVFETLLGAKEKHLALQPGQRFHSRSEPRLGFTGLRPLVRIAAGITDAFVERHQFAASCSTPVVLQHVAADREKPGAELTLPAKPIHSAKRA